MKFTIFVYGERGHASTVLDSLRSMSPDEYEIIGVCSTPPVPFQDLRGKLAKLRGKGGFIYQDPFYGYRHPHSFGYRKFISGKRGYHRTLAFLQKHKPDLILCCGYRYLLTEEITKTAKWAINIHPGLLPDRPGGTPNRWAVYRGDTETGVTAHIMTSHYDAGDILYQKRIPIAPGSDWGAVERSLQPLIREAANSIVYMADGRGEGFEMRVAQKDVHPARSLRGQMQVIDWKQPAEQIERLCRALRPKTGAMTVHRGEKVCLWDVMPVNVSGEPGVALGFDTVACGQGAIRIKTVLRNGRIMAAQGKPAGLPMQKGERLG